MSERIKAERTSASDQAERAVQLVWLRLPTKTEELEFSAFVEKHGLAAFCRVLFNSNEFLFVD